MTKVVNKRKEKFEVYIGRGSPFGNPFVIGVDGDRDEVIHKFDEYFCNKLATDSKFKLAVWELKDKVLGCYCKPQRCHGDIIANYVDGDMV